MPFMAPCETAVSFPVVMLYDHFSSVGVAMKTYAHLTRELESEFKTELRVWRMDVATSAEFSAAANADIAAAEVIIMTVRRNQPWPAEFLHWKEGADRTGATAPHAVIVLIEDEAGSPALTDRETWNSVLSSAATRIHPEVFVYETKPASDEWTLPRARESGDCAADCRADAYSN